MCEQCQYARTETLRSVVAGARPDQILRLLRDIRTIDDAIDGAGFEPRARAGRTPRRGGGMEGSPA